MRQNKLSFEFNAAANGILLLGLGKTCKVVLALKKAHDTSRKLVGPENIDPLDVEPLKVPIHRAPDDTLAELLSRDYKDFAVRCHCAHSVNVRLLQVAIYFPKNAARPNRRQAHLFERRLVRVAAE